MIPTVSRAPISSDPTSAPQRLPRPPITTTTKHSMMTSVPTPGKTVRAGPASAPPNPARTAPKAKTSVKRAFMLIPSASAISRSEEVARITFPVFVRYSRYQRRAATIGAITTTRIVYVGTVPPKRVIAPSRKAGLGIDLYSAPKTILARSSMMSTRA